MNKTFLIILAFNILLSCSERKVQNKEYFVIAKGQMPGLVTDKNNDLHLVYGTGDSIMYSHSSDNGNTFSRPLLISVLPGVYTFAMRDHKLQLQIQV